MKKLLRKKSFVRLSLSMKFLILRICVILIICFYSNKVYSALERVYTSTGGIISNGAIVDPYKWNDEWANLYNHPNDYLENMAINNATITSTTCTTFTGDITGDITTTGGMTCTDIANSTITGVTYLNVVTNLTYTSVTSGDSPYAVSNGDNLLIDATGGPITLTLPASPSVGWVFSYIDTKAYFSTNNLTINPNGKLFMGVGFSQCSSGTTHYPSSDNIITSITSYKLVYGSESSGWVYYDHGYDD